jgi:hypothetical protein
MTKRIGLVAGNEPELIEAFLERANREPAVEAVMVEIGGAPERYIGRHDVIVDRSSRHIPHYRAFLKAAALGGATVINDPFRASERDRFFALSLAARLGSRVPRTVLLPQKSYSEEIAPHQDLRNLEFPLKWSAIAHYVGFPAALRSIEDGRTRATVGDLDQLFAAFDGSGQGATMLQQFKPGQSLRAIVVGPHAWLQAQPTLTPEVTERAHREAVAIARALELELCSVDMVASGDDLWITDAGEAFPEIGRRALGDEAFDWVVGRLVEAAVALARNPQKTRDRRPWGALVR